jgi:hypothetical protein
VRTQTPVQKEERQGQGKVAARICAGRGKRYWWLLVHVGECAPAIKRRIGNCLLKLTARDCYNGRWVTVRVGVDRDWDPYERRRQEGGDAVGVRSSAKERRGGDKHA